MGSLGPPELIVILLILLLIFGSTQLPKLARSLGEARREFEKTSKDDKELDVDTRTPEEKKADELALREAELQRREDDLRRRE